MLQEFFNSFNHFIGFMYAQTMDIETYEVAIFEHLGLHRAHFLSHMAFFLGRTALAKLLINNPALEANNQSTLLFWACEKGFINLVKSLLENGSINETDNYKKTLLHIAAKKNHIALATFLIEKGISINAADIDENTALHLASKKNHIEMVKQLIEKGATINAANLYENTALYIACFNRYTELAQLLIEKGAAINVANISGNTPLHTACSVGLIRVVIRLLEKKVAINAINMNEKTALHLALEKGDVEIAKLLILYRLKNSKEKKPDFIKKYTMLSAYWDEILALKQMTSGSIALFDVYIMNNVNQLETLSANQEIQRLITTADFTNKYLFFGNKIKENFEKGLLAHKALNTLLQLTLDKRALPPELWRKVLGYLHNVDDLKHVAGLFFKSKPSNKLTEGISDTFSHTVSI